MFCRPVLNCITENVPLIKGPNNFLEGLVCLLFGHPIAIEIVWRLLLQTFQLSTGQLSCGWRFLALFKIAEGSISVCRKEGLRNSARRS
jgi:hypothetical protein